MELTVEEEVLRLGDSVVVLVEAEGPRLVGVDVSFGDGATGAEALPLPVHILRRFAHLYEDEGSYEIEAAVADAVGDTVRSTITVEVVP